MTTIQNLELGITFYWVDGKDDGNGDDGAGKESDKPFSFKTGNAKGCHQTSVIMQTPSRCVLGSHQTNVTLM